MAVYYKFTSAKDYDSIPIEGQFISVGTLKERIFELKHLGRGTDFDLMISNPQTNEEYDDESAMIPKNTSVWIRRVPGRPRKPIVAEPDEPKVTEDTVDELPPPSISSMLPGDSSSLKYMDYAEWDEFGSDLYAIPESIHSHPSNPVPEIPPESRIDEESKIKALVETPALEWNRQGQDAYGGGRGFGRGMGGRMMGGRGFGRGGFERKTPPVGYICHRCKVPGHFIQHCPTNGDPNYDIRKVKPPTGIPKSMLMTTSDGPYALPSGAVAVLKPNEAAFEKEIEGLPSIRQVSDLPPELRCPLCKEVMKDAVLTSKCCFRSFCDKCIRDYIITKSTCVCGATDVLADDLLPNKTLRETITRILESTTSSTENAGSLVQIQDLESARNVPPRVPSPTVSAASKGEPKQSPRVDYSSDVKVSHVKEGDAASEGKGVNDVNHSLDNKTSKNTDLSEATPESMSAKEPMSPESAPVPEEVHEKLLGGEQAKKKKKKKTRMPINAADMQWRAYQDFGPEGYAGMPMAPAAYSPYWNGGMPMGMDGFMQPFGGAMPYMGYAPSPLDMPFGGMLPQDPFAAQGYMMPSFPPRDLSELGMGMNQGIMPPMSRGEFEAMKADIRRKREFERLNDRANVRDRRVISREVGSSGADGSSMKAKPRSVSESERFDRPDRSERSKRLERTSMDHRHNNGQSRHSPPLPPRPAKRPTSSSADQHRHGHQGPGGSSSLVTAEATADAAGGADKRHKASVFSRISFPGEQEDREKEGSRKRRAPSASASMGVVAADKEHSGHSHNHRREERRSALVMAAESSEDDDDVEHHFKRRPSSASSRREDREREEETRHSSRGSRERDIDRHRERRR